MAIENFQRMQEGSDDDEDARSTKATIELASHSKPTDLRSRLNVIIHSHSFMVGVIVLVVLDCIMVIAELLFDLEIVKLGDEHHYVPHIFHYCSLAILTVFLIEVSVRIFVLRLDFFKHKLEVLDAVVVIVSWVLDIVFRNNEDAATGVGLLIILRLWRITRIINGIVLSVQKQAEQKVEKEKHMREEAEAQVKRFRQYCSALESRMLRLEELAKHNGLDLSSVPEVNTHKPNDTLQVVGEKDIKSHQLDNEVADLNDIVSEVNAMGGSDKQ